MEPAPTGVALIPHTSAEKPHHGLPSLGLILLIIGIVAAGIVSILYVWGERIVTREATTLSR